MASFAESGLRFGDTILLFDRTSYGFVSGDGILNRLTCDALTIQSPSSSRGGAGLSTMSSPRGAGGQGGGHGGELPIPPHLRLCRFRVLPRYTETADWASRLEGKQVHLGMTVMLQHCDSARYVVMNRMRAELDPSAMRLELSDPENDSGAAEHGGSNGAGSSSSSGGGGGSGSGSGSGGGGGGPAQPTRNNSGSAAAGSSSNLSSSSQSSRASAYEAATFRLHPGYKSKKSGERVAFMDTVLLVSEPHAVSWQVSDFKHNELAHAYVKDVHEVNALSGAGTRLQIVPSSRSLKLEPALARMVCAGSAFTLMHRDKGAHLEFKQTLDHADPSMASASQRTAATAFGSLSASQTDHNAVPHFVVQKRLSSNSVWKLESVNAVWEGSLASKDSLFRIKHMASQRYLAASQHPITGLMHMHMTLEYLSPGTTFVIEDYDASSSSASSSSSPSSAPPAPSSSSAAGSATGGFASLERGQGKGGRKNKAHAADSTGKEAPATSISWDDLLYISNAHASKESLKHGGEGVVQGGGYIALDTSVGASEPVSGAGLTRHETANAVKSAKAKVWKKVAMSASLLNKMGGKSEGGDDEIMRVSLSARDPKDALDIEPVDANYVSAIGSMRSSLLQLLKLRAALRQEAPMFPVVAAGDPERTQDEIDSILAAHDSFVRKVSTLSPMLVDVMSTLVRSCSISDVQDPLVREGMPVLATQLLLREQGTMAAVLEIHHAVFVTHNIPVWSIERGRLGLPFFKFLQLSYRMLKAIVKDNPENKVALAPHSKAIQMRLGSSLKAITTLQELFCENPRLLKTTVDQDMVVKIISLTQSAGRHARYLDFLSAICLTQEDPITKNQNLICSELMERDDVLMSVDFKNSNVCWGELQLVMSRPGPGTEGTASSQDFVATANHLLAVDTASLDVHACEFMYVMANWRLFINLSQGRNRRVIDCLLGQSDRFGLIYPQLVNCVNSAESVPHVMRSVMLSLIIAFFVDREPLQPVPRIHRTRVWQAAATRVKRYSRIKVDPWVKFESLRPPTDFDEIKNLIVAHMKEISGKVKEGKNAERGRNGENERRKRRVSMIEVSDGEVSNVGLLDLQRLRKALQALEWTSSIVSDPTLISVMFQHVKAMTFAANDIVIKQDDVGDTFYIIDKGTCEAFIQAPGKAIKISKKYHAGDSFGDLALLYKRPRAATIVATSEVRVLALDGEVFRAAVGSAQDSAKRQVGDLMLTRSIANASLKLLELGFYHTENEAAYVSEAKFDEIGPMVSAIVDALNFVPVENESADVTLLDYKVRCTMLSVLELCFDTRTDQRISLMTKKFDQLFKTQFPACSELIRNMGDKWEKVKLHLKSGLLGGAFGKASLAAVAPAPQEEEAPVGLNGAEEEGGGAVTQKNRVAPRVLLPRPQLNEALDLELAHIDSILQDQLPSGRFVFTYGPSAEQELFGTPIIHSSVSAAQCISGSQVPSIVPCLMRLISFSDDTLSCTAFSLLHSHMIQRHSMCQKAASVQMLAYPEMIDAYAKCTASVSELRRQQKWLKSDGEQQSVAIVETGGVLQELVGIMAQGGFKKRRKVQLLLANLKADEYVMFVLKVARDKLKVATSPEFLKTTSLCLEFVTRFTAKNLTNASRIFKLTESLALLTILMGIEDLDVAQAITSVLHGNPNLLTTAIDKKFVGLIMDMLEEHGPQVRWIELFSSIINDSEGKPIRKNQDMISIAFASAPKHLVDPVCGSIEMHNNRAHLLIKGKSPGVLPECVLYGNALVHLLAQTCQGGNMGSQVRARLIVSLDAATRNVLDLDCIIDEAGHRVPSITEAEHLNQAGRDQIHAAFLGFLQHVFFESNSDTVRETLLSPNSRVWSMDTKTHPDWKERYGTQTLVPFLARTVRLACFPLSSTEEGDEEEHGADGRALGWLSSGSDGEDGRNSPFEGGRHSPEGDEIAPEQRRRCRPFAQMALSIQPDRIKFAVQCVSSCSSYLSYTSNGQEDGHDLLHKMFDLLSRAIMNQSDSESLVRVMYRLQKALKVDKLLLDRDSAPSFTYEPSAFLASEDDRDDSVEHEFATICELYIEGWAAFCDETACVDMGVQDLERGFGIGFSLLTQLCLQKEPYTKDGTGHVHNLDVLRRLCEIIVKAFMHRKSSTSLVFDIAPTVIGLLSSCIHMEGAHTAAQKDETFTAFVENRRPTKPRQELLQIQNKYDKLGATAAAVSCFCGSEDAVLQLASLRLLLNLLHGTNRTVQTTLHTVLTARVYMHGDERFAEAVVKSVQSSSLLFKKYQDHVAANQRQDAFEDPEDAFEDDFERAQMRKRASTRRRGSRSVSSLSQSDSLHFAVGDENPGQVQTSTFLEADEVYCNSLCCEAVHLICAMCQGQFHDLQVWLLRQNNKVTFNIVRELASALELLVSTEDLYRHGWIIDATTLILSSLEKCCEGPCRPVQAELASSNFPNIVDGILLGSLLQEPPLTAILHDQGRQSWLDDQVMVGRSDMSNDLRLKTQHSAIKVLRALLEASNSSLIPSRLLDSVSVDAVKTMVRQHWSLRAQLHSIKLHSPELAGSALLLHTLHDKRILEPLIYDSYFLMCSLGQFDPDAGLEEFSGATTDFAPSLLEWLKLTVQTVEVVHEGCVVRLTYEQPHGLQLLSRFKAYREQQMHGLFDVSLDNPTDKAVDFLTNVRCLTEQVKYLQKWVDHSTLSRWMYSSMSMMQTLCFRLALACTVVEVVSFGVADREPGNKAGLWGGSSTWRDQVAPALSLAHIVIAVLQCYQYFVFAAPLSALQPINRGDDFAGGGEERGGITAWLGLKWNFIVRIFRADMMPVFNIVMLVVSFFACITTLSRREGARRGGREEEDRRRGDRIMDLSVENTGLQSNIFYPLLLLDYLRTKAGKVVVGSIRTGGAEMVGIVLIGVLVMLIFAILIFEAENAVEERKTLFCHTLFDCVFRTMTLGFTEGLEDVLGEGMIDVSQAEDLSLPTQAVTRAIAIVLFFVIWNMFLQNIIIGQIVDSFTQIRDVKKNRDADLKQRCFVCSVERSAFLNTGGFEVHVFNHHRPSAYLGYSLYLASKPRHELNGLEKNVAECIDASDISFLPIGRPLVLEKSHAAQSVGSDSRHTQDGPLTAMIAAQSAMIKQMQSQLDSLETRVMESQGFSSFDSSHGRAGPRHLSMSPAAPGVPAGHGSSHLAPLNISPAAEDD